ncbi:hypothetical protein NUW58_g2016 [Xylaria curta]|uniref:Uncharacterized protein n=1 Tax=Xylaria curta TaxID=42375 RepID=A0ACC1PHJ6_9PEZI|nr:hypothetical protein NUW58_g2016 [Xylaria curta]
METYEYSALPNDHSIRILTLYAGCDDEPLRGGLVNLDVSRLEHESYEPLSYVWGNPTRAHDFDCDGKTIGLTESLYYALKRIRLANRDRRVWVDQICINQEDTSERSDQVQFMNRIYKCANHVLVWLGADEQGAAEAAFGRVKALAKTFVDVGKYEEFVADHTGDNFKLRSQEDWASIQHLTSLPWFERAWIVQEIGTTSPATLLWGAHSIDWGTLYQVCERLTAFHHLRRHFNINTAKVKFVFQRFVPPDLATRHANRLSFIYELHRARHLKATDPRDRVFAFLGHYSVTEGKNKELQRLEPDYHPMTGTIPRVYSNAAACALRGGGTEGGLIVLGSVQHLSLPADYSEWNELRQRKEYMPSWVPDWRTYTSHILSEPTSPHRASGRFSNQDLKIEAGEAILKNQRGGGNEPQVDILWKEVCNHGGSSSDGSALFNLEYSYPDGSGDGDGCGGAVLAFMQTLMDYVSRASSDQSNHPPAAPPIPTPPPVERTATPPPRVSSPRPSVRTKKKRLIETPTLGLLDTAVPPINILIVEDNMINLRLLEAFVKRLKVRWQTAVNGREAVDKWRAGGFHLVLMDIQLPIMNGLDATREIRRIEKVNSIGVFSSSASSPPDEVLPEPAEEDRLANTEMFKSPVIIVALTASSLQSDRHEALAAGCNDFLTKPVNFDWLQRKVKEWGCMQALIDFDGWRKWKDFSQKTEADEAAKKAAVASKAKPAKKNRVPMTAAA